jgi:hypothetical protein
LGGHACRTDERALQSASGVEMVARPDHSHRGRGGLAVVAPKIVTDCFEEPSVGSQIVHHRLRHLAAPREASREFLIPPCDTFRAGDDLLAGTGAVAFVGPAPLPQVEHRITGEAERCGARDETRHFGERDGLGSLLGEITTKGVVEAS